MLIKCSKPSGLGKDLMNTLNHATKQIVKIMKRQQKNDNGVNPLIESVISIAICVCLILETDSLK